MSNQFQVKDSGDRRTFETGAKRDVDYDKPRFDLIPPTVLKEIIRFKLTTERENFAEMGLIDDCKTRMWNLGISWGDNLHPNLLIEIICICLDMIQEHESDKQLNPTQCKYPSYHIISPMTYHRIAMLYSRGAQKYDPWNWAKGMPISVFHASLMRHIFAVIKDETDEDHLSAVFFNAACILHFGVIGRDDVDDIAPRLAEWYKYENNKS